MEQFAVVGILGVLLLILVGSICGLSALVRVLRIEKDLKRFELDLMRLGRDLRRDAKAPVVYPPIREEKGEAAAAPMPPPLPPRSETAAPVEPPLRESRLGNGRPTIL